MMFIALIFVILALVTPTITYRGDVTFYSPGMGSCGIVSSDSEPIVALAVSMMRNPANPNQNPKCGGQIYIFHSRTGKIHFVTVVDTCWNCDYQDIDLSPSAFREIFPNGDGRVHGVEWRFVG